MKRAVSGLFFLLLGCAGAGVEGRAARAARGPWGAGDAEAREGPVRYLDWYVGAGYSVKHWKDRYVDEDQWFPGYEVSLIYHLGYSWDIEFSNWAGRFIHPVNDWKLQSFVHTLCLRYTRPAGLGWWHVSLGGGWCNNDNVDAHDVPALRAAAGYTYPVVPRLNLGANVSYIRNETHHLDVWGGDAISLSVISVTASVAFTF